MKDLIPDQAWRLPTDTTIEEDLRSQGDILFEMSNLDQKYTGISTGFVWISTEMAGHAARVKFYVKIGKRQPSFSVSISETPEVVANSLDARTMREMAPIVIEFVRLNFAALRKFWYHGDEMTASEVESMKLNFHHVEN